MTNTAKGLVLAMSASFVLLATQTSGFIAGVGYFWGGLLLVAVIAGWNRVPKS